MAEVGPGIHRLGTRVVNFYVVEEAGRFTVVDGGAPRQIGQLVRLLESSGRGLADIEAIVLTHAHADHMGIVEQARRRSGAVVHVHQHDHRHALGEPLPGREAGMLRYLWRPAAWRTLVGLAAGGIANVPDIVEASSFGDGAVLDVPGGLRAIHAPGHTPGSCALLLRGGGTLLSGDVLVTRNPLTGHTGPQVMPAGFNDDTQLAIDSLDRLSGLDAGTILPGHGDPWRGSVDEAVVAARAAGRS